MALVRKFVKAGKWRTLAWSYNSSFSCGFQLPIGAQVRVVYGPGISTQRQTLDGTPIMLRVGGASIVVARVQMRVDRDVWVEFDYWR